jgi:hypothetical protein
VRNDFEKGRNDLLEVRSEFVEARSDLEEVQNGRREGVGNYPLKYVNGLIKDGKWIDWIIVVQKKRSTYLVLR